MSLPITLLNGRFIDAEQPALFLNERGFQYGDGLFETMLLRGGSVRFLSDHFERLQLGCDRLAILAPASNVLSDELQMLCGEQQNGVVKFILTRGRTERGYRAASDASPTRVWQLFAPLETASSGINVRWCETRLSRNAQLAGIKHCNRLEQVLAQAEWRDVDRDANIAEGFMLDTEGELVCATMSNVFLVLNGVLVTPDLRYSGIAGVMRKNILRLAAANNLEYEQRAIRAEEVQPAEEIFVCNAVRGIQPVVALAERQWPIGAITRQLITALKDC